MTQTTDQRAEQQRLISIDIAAFGTALWHEVDGELRHISLQDKVATALIEAAATDVLVNGGGE